MPNYDAGHYFLTALAPVRPDSTLRHGQSRSRRHLIREALAAMPTGERSAVSQGKGRDNPFARCLKTHFARFVVLDDVVFNGRVSGDTLLATARRINPLQAQPVDRLSTPFLIFVADFDARSGEDSELKAYLAELWGTMAAELEAVFQHCVGFASVKTADDFIRYIKQCQIETTMPFNDYWSVPPSLSNLNLIPYGIGAAAAALLAIAGLVTCKAWLFLVPLAALAGIAFLAYRKVMEKALLPFPESPPPAPAADLPTVLKALYLQRAFTAFAIRMQGQSEQALHEAFAGFVAEHKPDDTAAPTQMPGVIGV